jgi:hypothetical protein
LLVDPFLPNILYVVQRLGVLQVRNDWLKYVSESLEVCNPLCRSTPSNLCFLSRGLSAHSVALTLYTPTLQVDSKPTPRPSPADGMVVVASDSVGTVTGAVVCPNRSTGHVMLVHVRAWA